MSEPEKTLVVDANNILTRAIKAMEKQDGALSAHGVPTGALMVFVNSLSRYVREEQPDRLVVCWDAGHAYRSEIFPEYKAGRTSGIQSETRDSHFGLAKRFLTLAGVHHVVMRGVEADDLIAHYWRIRNPDDKMIILSGDKDLLQLLEENVQQIRPGDSLSERWTHDRVESEFGCTPEQLPLAMALAGDTSDGIPGISGVGMKTAVKWLAKEGWSLHELIESGLPRLEGQRDVLLRNFKLVNLRTNDLGISLVMPPLFMPTEPDITVVAEQLSDFLDLYELSKIRERWTAGTLWRDSQHGTRLALPMKI